MKNVFFSLLLIFIVTSGIFAQEEETEKKYSLNGYITNMQSVLIYDSIGGNWINDNLIHNRLNFNWYPKDYLSFDISARTRFFSGDRVRQDTLFSENMSKDNGIINMNRNIFSENSFLLNSQIDRAYFAFEEGNLNVTLGRQRINWGRSFVWNPNDIFNSYSFFDFDYPEKPGSDALRIQYYTSATSSAELVVKADSAKKVSGAGLFKFAAGGYDFQIIAGMINEQDYVIGTGWEGNIKSVSFKGEASYLHPKTSFKDTTGVVVASASLSYVFSNSLMLQSEFLYLGSGTIDYEIDSVTGLVNVDLVNRDLSVKNLSVSKYSLFGSISYPITPLLNASISAIYYPDLKGYYIGPSLTYSLADNLDFAVIAQTFRIKDFNDFKLSFAFLQLKYNF